MMGKSYDFVIVGAGPAGCTLASRLSRSSKAPSVLLVEAGGSNTDPELRVDGDRWITRGNQEMNYRYETIAQRHLNDRVIAYDRGKGLGGTSAINFCIYNVGARDDFDEMAERTGDVDWQWKRIQERFKGIENYHGGEVEGSLKRFLRPKPVDHGRGGRLGIGFPANGERSLCELLDICEKAGCKMNSDVNSGDPIGFGACPGSAHRGIRSTAADLLEDSPANLEVKVDTPIRRLVIEGKKVVGVETISNEVLSANKEVILCTGAVDSPKLLMLSGIGPASTLSNFDIPVVSDLPQVGRGLKDHNHVNMTWKRSEGWSERPNYYRNAEAAAEARKQWRETGTGPLAEYGVSLGVAYLKSQQIYETDEFNGLPSHVKKYLQSPTVPSFEILMNGPDRRDFGSPSTSEASSSFTAFVLNPQSEGKVDIKSNNIYDPPVIDPNLLSHEYDRRVAIEVLREMTRFVENPAFAKDTLGPVVAPPPDGSDEELLSWWKANCISTWHPTGTVQIDTREKGKACLDSDMRVHGVHNLRVGDLSVVPMIPNCHTQSTAYVVGATLGDKIAREYKMD